MGKTRKLFYRLVDSGLIPNTERSYRTLRQPPSPSPELAEKARQLAWQAADERGVSIDRICIQANAATGDLKVIVLD